jgi:hypothetical protein
VQSDPELKTRIVGYPPGFIPKGSHLTPGRAYSWGYFNRVDEMKYPFPGLYTYRHVLRLEIPMELHPNLDSPCPFPLPGVMFSNRLVISGPTGTFDRPVGMDQSVLADEFRHFPSPPDPLTIPLYQNEGGKISAALYTDELKNIGKHHYHGWYWFGGGKIEYGALRDLFNPPQGK